MTGQLDTSLYNASGSEACIEELQEQIDNLNMSVGCLSEKVDETTQALNDYKTENQTQVSTGELISNDASISNLTSNTINGTTLCITGTSNQQTVNATDVCATGAVHADRLYGSLIGVGISGTSLLANTGCIKNCLKVGGLDASYANINGSLTAGTFESDCIYNNGDATILGSLKSKGIELTNGTGLTGNSVEVNGVWANILLCSRGLASIDCDLTVKGNITAKNVCGKVDSTKATITNATIDNLTVNNTLTVANGITLPDTLGDTTLTKVTTDSLIVNGDTELNGTVKAGSIAIGDGSITAGEVCIGAKGVVIDKDKNASFADVSSSNLTAENVNVNTKINASCVESTDVVATNAFAKNFYPENITVDKDVGDLHYSYQLDTDAVGGVLVDCKTVLPKERTHTCFPKNGYIEEETSAEETTYGKQKALKYTKRGNGLCLTSTVYRTDVCHSNYKNTIDFINKCSDPGITGDRGTGFAITNSDVDDLKVFYYYDTCTCPFIDYHFCDDTSKETTTIICSCNLDVASKNINVKNISTCSVNDENKVLKIDNCGNVYSGKVVSSLIGSECACYNDCTLQTSYISQVPSRFCYYCINNETAGAYSRSCQDQSCQSISQCILQCCYCTCNPYESCGCCYYTYADTMNRSISTCRWCCDWNSNTNEQFQCIIDENESRNFGCPIKNCVMFYKCCCSCNDPTKNYCVCYWDYTYNGLGGRYDFCGDFRGPKPSYFCRSADCHPELGWCFSICDDNLYVTNPQCIVCCGDKNQAEDILRVEDGKIYTKCGEFVAGGGGSQTAEVKYCDNDYNQTLAVDTSLVENENSITANKSSYSCICKNIAQSDIGYCLCSEEIYCNGVGFTDYTLGLVRGNSDGETQISKTYKQITTPTARVNCRAMIPLCIELSTNIVLDCYGCCTDAGRIIYYAEKYNPNFTIYDSSGCVYSDLSYSCTASTKFRGGGLCLGDNSKKYKSHCLFINSSEYINDKIYSLTNNCSSCSIDIFTGEYNYECSSNDNCFSDLNFNSSSTKKFIALGDAYNLTHSGYDDSSYTFEACFTSVLNCTEIKLVQGCICSYSNEYDSGSFERCDSVINGTCWDICYTGVDNCYNVECYINGEYKGSFLYTNRIDFDGKIEGYNNARFVTNMKEISISSLPTTNTLVPLAGTVNGKGFAFFCKGSDGVKFYDSSFAVVDAGSATNVTYLVTTGV